MKRDREREREKVWAKKKPVGSKNNGVKSIKKTKIRFGSNKILAHHIM